MADSRTDWSTLFRDHVVEISGMAERSLAVSEELSRDAADSGKHQVAFGGIVFHAGDRQHYHADDLAMPFRPLPHFTRFAPIAGPDHLLLFRPGEPVRLGWVVPRDYWEEPPPRPEHPFAEVLDVIEAPSLEATALLLGDLSDCAYVGSSPEIAAQLGIPVHAVEPRSLLAPLDWYRGFKTPYEVECIRQATRRAAAGHRAARRGVEEGLSERDVHRAYLAASDQLESETPYPNIVAWDDRSSVLHYQTKRGAAPEPGLTFLIDAGAAVNGYACDITRTYARSGTHPVFAEILDRLEGLQQRVAGRVAPGVSYVDLHAAAVRGVAEILSEVGVLRVQPAEAIRAGLPLPFLPHGLGHHLGLQVHDVGGLQITREGEVREPPEEHWYLRTTRELDAGHVVTIEPGLYFIPLLLDPLRSGPRASSIDWRLVDELIPCGGIRIEDDVLVTPTGCENLTRPWVPGHRDAAV